MPSEAKRRSLSQVLMGKELGTTRQRSRKESATSSKGFGATTAGTGPAGNETNKVRGWNAEIKHIKIRAIQSHVGRKRPQAPT